MELLKSALKIFGVLFVLICGITMMLVLSASNWDTLFMVNKVCLMCFISRLFYIMYRCSRIFYSLLLLIRSPFFVRLNCIGNETTILDCPHSHYLDFDYSCSLSTNANIFCQCKYYFPSMLSYPVFYSYECC